MQEEKLDILVNNAGATWGERLDGYKGPGNCIWSQAFYETDRSRHFLRGYTMEITRGRGPVATAMTGNYSGRVPFGEGHHRVCRDLFNRITDHQFAAEERRSICVMRLQL